MSRRQKSTFKKTQKTIECFVKKKCCGAFKKKLNFKNEACGLIEIKKLDASFPDYQLIVLNDLSETVYLNAEKKCKKFIYLLHTDNHFDVILSMKAFLKTFILV